MKSPWHVYNLKRRIASLPPITLETFKNKIQEQFEPPQFTSERSHQENADDEESVSPKQCLFCHLTFDDGTEDLDQVVEHMFAAHGLFIPDQAHLSDPASFLGYLATQVRVWHECLYCGVVRTSTAAIQSHMNDSGHCRLNFEKEPELQDFWEHRVDADLESAVLGIKSASSVRQELKLSTGRTVSSKPFHPSKPRVTRTTRVRPALTAGPESPQSQEPSGSRDCRQLARRDEMGIQNLSSQQRRALVVATKRSQKEEAMARRAKEWTYARKANDQKHDQNYGALAWAKGGLHNLLPR